MCLGAFFLNHFVTVELLRPSHCLRIIIFESELGRGTSACPVGMTFSSTRATFIQATCLVHPGALFSSFWWSASWFFVIGCSKTNVRFHHIYGNRRNFGTVASEVGVRMITLVKPPFVSNQVVFLPKQSNHMFASKSFLLIQSTRAIMVALFWNYSNFNEARVHRVRIAT